MAKQPAWGGRTSEISALSWTKKTLGIAGDTPSEEGGTKEQSVRDGNEHLPVPQSVRCAGEVRDRTDNGGNEELEAVDLISAYISRPETLTDRHPVYLQ
jgi:hypothetical protein